MDLHVWDVLNMIWQFFENVCVCLCVVLFLIVCRSPKFCGHCITRTNGRKMDETSYSVAPLCNLVLIRFWCTSLKMFRCCSIFMISLTQWYRKKLRAIVPKTNYLKRIILKFKTFIYNSNRRSYIVFWRIHIFVIL